MLVSKQMQSVMLQWQYSPVNIFKNSAGVSGDYEIAPTSRLNAAANHDRRSDVTTIWTIGASGSNEYGFPIGLRGENNSEGHLGLKKPQ